MRRDREISGLVQRDFGIIYDGWIDRNWRYPAYEFIQDAFNRYLLKHYPLTTSVMQLRRFQQDRVFKDLLSFMPEKEVASKLLVKAAQILSGYGYNAAMVLQGVLDGTLRAYLLGKRKGLVAVSVEDIEKLRLELRKQRPLLTRQQVAQIMSVKITTVTAWIEQGLLTPAKKQGAAMYLNRGTVEIFQRGYVFVGEAAEILGIGELVVQKWARSGRLKAVSGPGSDGLLCYLFRREDVERLRPENRLTGPQLARQLGISRS